MALPPVETGATYVTVSWPLLGPDLILVIVGAPGVVATGVVGVVGALDGDGLGFVAACAGAAIIRVAASAEQLATATRRTRDDVDTRQG